MSGSPRNEMIKGFVEEVETYIPSLIKGLETLKEAPESSDMLQEIHRLVHTIKGASSLLGVTGLSHIAFQMEEALEDIISGQLPITEEALAVMSRTIDQFREYCNQIFKGVPDERAMLTETVLAFRRLRGFPPDRDEEALGPLLETLSEQEAVFLESLPKVEPEENAKAPLPEQSEIELPPELMQNFYEEAEEHLQDLANALNTLDAEISEPVQISPQQREILRQIRRSVHTVKGAAAVIGFKDFSSCAHETEDLLDWLYEDAQQINPDIIKVLIDSADLFERIIADPKEAHSPKAQSIKELYRVMMNADPSREKRSASLSEPEPVIDMIDILPVTSGELPPVGAQEGDVETALQKEDHGEKSDSDFFVEQRNTLDAATRRFSRTLRVNPERVDELVNLAGELIISLSTFEQKMDIFTDAVNELELSRDRLRDIARDMEVGYEVKALEQLETAPIFSATPAGAAIFSTGGMVGKGDFDDFDTLELDRYSELNLIIRSLNESAIDVGAINTQLANLYSDFDGYLNRHRVLLSELQEKMMRVRMTPMAIIINKMRRTVREVAANLGKQAGFVIEGEDIELDRLIWEKISDPLMHLLRNAVDHGLEPPALRQALGKPPTGTVKLAASREGNQVVIRIEDDGAGINYQAIRATAQKTGLSDSVDEMSENELAALIFHPGFSTRGEISEVSGRGIGLDVVKENIHELNGTVKIDSREGNGTQFTIRIPLTLAVVQALMFTAEERVFAIALNEISEIIRVDPDNIINQPQEAVRLGDEVIPIHHLAKVLNIDQDDENRADESVHPLVLVIERGGKRSALVIDTLIGQREIVIKDLGSHLGRVKGISGATIMGDGSVVPILNIEEILGAETVVSDDMFSEHELVPQFRSDEREKPLEILVVDDSVSVRRVVTRLMENQGWKTQTAKDGLDALEKLREVRPDLIVLDIEMPRMNGYEFMAALKGQPVYEKIPVVVLTSRTAAKHREKARSLGATGFVIKPYKDAEFINLVLKLTGRDSQ